MSLPKCVFGLMALLLLTGCSTNGTIDANAVLPEAEGDSAVAAAGGSYQVKFETSQGDFVVEVYEDWAPLGAARFKELVEAGFYNDTRFFRVIDGFMCQFGISGDPATMAKWRDKRIKDDKVKGSNTRGMITFATSGADSRTTQVFINFADNKNLDSLGFAPFGKVIQGMDVVDKLYKGYGEGAPSGNGPSQSMIQQQGNKYLDASFPKLDQVKKATIVTAKDTSS